MEVSLKQISKLLSLVLRHKPEQIGITLDGKGWTPVDILIQKMNEQGININKALLQQVVDSNDKKRFAFNEDHTMIRASQGHSVAIDLDYAAMIPPDILFHGTAEKFLPAIKEHGLIKQQRHHVHLSVDKETALKVGQRQGKPVILTISAGKMHEQGFSFYLSANGVWLTDHVPIEYISS